MLAMVGTDTALTGVVGKTAEGCTFIKSEDGVRAERAEAHSGDVENRGRIGLGADVTADVDPKRRWIGDGRWHCRMGDKLVPVGVNVN